MQPRYLYPVFACFALLVAAGLHQLLGRFGASLRWSFVPMVAIAALTLWDFVQLLQLVGFYAPEAR